MDPEKVLVIQEAMKRGLGEGDVTNIEVLGGPIESLRADIHQLFKASKK